MKHVLSRAAFCTALGAAAVAPARAQGTSPTQIRIAGIVVEDIAPIYYAQANGIFRKYGLDVHFDPASSGAAVVASVTSGAYEIGKGSVVSAFRAVSRGVPIVAVAPGWIYDNKNPSAEFMVAADSPIKTGADLNGKTIAVGSLNELNQMAAMEWVDKHGGDARSLKFIELPVAASGAALAAHRIDATVLLEPALSAAIAAGGVRSLGSAFGAIAPTFPVSLWFANSAWASAHRDQAKAFARALSEASDYINHHPDEAVALLATATQTSADALRKIKRVADGTSLSVAMLQPLLDAAQKYVNMPALSLRDFVI
jgi:NitT/TauT family transport system substrate-binding protein